MALMTQVGMEFIARNRANMQISSFTRSIQRMGRQLLAVAGVGGFGYLIRQSMVSIDRIAKMSDELRLSTEAITGWEHAAKISGTSIENLHKGLEIFVRRMGEAKYGVGEGVRGLQMLGLTAQQLISMGTEEMFLHVAERISQAGTAAEQAAIAYNFFGRQGAQLLNMFQQGRSGIEAMRQEADKLGLTFSRFAAFQVEMANDALTRLRSLFTGIFRQVTIQMSPYIEALATKFVDVATAGEGMGANITNVFESITLSVVTTAQEVETLIARFRQLRHPLFLREAEIKAIERYRSITGDVEAFTRKMRGGPGAGIPEMVEPKYREIYQKAVQQERAKLGIGAIDRTGAIRIAFDAIRKRAADLQQSLILKQQAEEAFRLQPEAPAMGMLEGVRTIERSTMDIANAYRDMYKDMQRMTMDNYCFRVGILEDLKKKYMDYGLARLQVEQWFNEQVKLLDIKRLQISDNFLDGLRAAGMQMQLEMKSWGKIAYEAAMTFQTSFGDAFADVLMGVSTVKDAFRNLLVSIQRSILTNIGQRIAGQIIGAVFGGGSGGGRFSLGMEIGRTMQHGGLVTQPTVALLGERGPELVTPLSELGQGRGSGDMTIIVENRGSPMQIVSADLRYEEDQRILNLVVDDISRGGRVKHIIKNVINTTY